MKELNRNCDTCEFKGSRVDMVAPDCSGTVDYCKKGHSIYKAEPCKDEVKDKWVGLVEKIRTWTGY